MIANRLYVVKAYFMNSQIFQFEIEQPDNDLILVDVQLSLKVLSCRVGNTCKICSYPHPTPKGLGVCHADETCPSEPNLVANILKSR